MENQTEKPRTRLWAWVVVVFFGIIAVGYFSTQPLAQNIFSQVQSVFNPNNQQQNTYYLQHGDFSVYFPTYPTYLSNFENEVTKGNWVQGQAYYTIYPSTGDNELAATYTPSPFKNQLAARDNLKAEENYTASTGDYTGKIIYSNPTSVDGFPAVDYIIQSKNIYIRARDILKGSDLYSLGYYYYPGKEDKQLEDTFFNSLKFGQSHNAILVTSKVFYLQVASNVRSCPSSSCSVIGSYPPGANWELPYATINNLPTWVKIGYSNGNSKVAYISKDDFGENQVSGQSSTQTQDNAQTENVPPSVPNNQPPSNLISQVEPAIVEVNCWATDGSGTISMGSGSVVGPKDGVYYVVTNYHVYAMAGANPTCYATFPQPPLFETNFNYGDYSLQFYASNYHPENYQDWANFAITSTVPGSSTLSNVPTIPNLPICSDAQIGDMVTVFGYPASGNYLGISETVTHGTISGILSGPIYKFDGNIDHGNSGGLAVDNDSNCLLGIPTWGVSGATGGTGYIQSYSLGTGGN